MIHRYIVYMTDRYYFCPKGHRSEGQWCWAPVLPYIHCKMLVKTKLILLQYLCLFLLPIPNKVNFEQPRLRYQKFNWYKMGLCLDSFAELRSPLLG